MRCIFNDTINFHAYKSEIKHSYIHGEWNAQQLDLDCNYVVIDDIPLNQLKQYKQFLVCQQEYTVTDKYLKKRNIRN